MPEDFRLCLRMAEAQPRDAFLVCVCVCVGVGVVLGTDSRIFTLSYVPTPSFENLRRGVVQLPGLS